MGVLAEVLALLGLVEDAGRYGRPGSGLARTREEHRELAEMMRGLPGLFTDRLSGSALERITGLAAAGWWEEAVDELITALHARAEAVTHAERAKLRAVLQALNMSGERVDALLLRP